MNTLFFLPKNPSESSFHFHWDPIWPEDVQVVPFRKCSHPELLVSVVSSIFHLILTEYLQRIIQQAYFGDLLQRFHRRCSHLWVDCKDNLESHLIKFGKLQFLLIVLIPCISIVRNSRDCDENTHYVTYLSIPPWQPIEQYASYQHRSRA